MKRKGEKKTILGGVYVWQNQLQVATCGFRQAVAEKQ
jgi:hypothetical protein